MSLPKETMQFFAAFIEKEIGIVYSEVNYYQLESRLDEIARGLNYPTTQAMCSEALIGGIRGAMKLALIDAATNNETSFFRDMNVFQAIRAHIEQSDSTRYVGGQPLRVWSAACSTGQEIYSLAMLFAEIAAARPFAYTIDATDISERVLARARQGRYTALEVHRGLTPTQLSANFTAEDPANGGEAGMWQVRSELRRGLTFNRLNLLDPWPGVGHYDLILCRNVLIYQTVESKRGVVAKLYDHILPGGVLILGGAESLIGLNDELEYVNLGGVVLYRRRGAPKAVAS